MKLPASAFRESRRWFPSQWRLRRERLRTERWARGMLRLVGLGLVAIVLLWAMAPYLSELCGSYRAGAVEDGSLLDEEEVEP